MHAPFPPTVQSAAPAGFELGKSIAYEGDCPAQTPPNGGSGIIYGARVAAGQPVRYLVPDPVAAYIEREGLYR